MRKAKLVSQVKKIVEFVLRPVGEGINDFGEEGVEGENETTSPDCKASAICLPLGDHDTGSA